MFDAEKFDKLVAKYPKLPLLLTSGVISMKVSRNMLDIDRWLMDDLYLALIECQAVLGIGSSTFKATPAALAYIEERRGDFLGCGI